MVSLTPRRCKQCCLFSVPCARWQEPLVSRSRDGPWGVSARCHPGHSHQPTALASLPHVGLCGRLQAAATGHPSWPSPSPCPASSPPAPCPTPSGPAPRSLHKGTRPPPSAGWAWARAPAVPPRPTPHVWARRSAGRETKVKQHRVRLRCQQGWRPCHSIMGRHCRGRCCTRAPIPTAHTRTRSMRGWCHVRTAWQVRPYVLLVCDTNISSYLSVILTEMSVGWCV